MDTTALPSELLMAPQPLIGFCGLDITKNLVHKSIWDAFNNNRKTNGAAVQFKIIPSNYEFPVVKPKRPSYEWYHPKGILKRNWMLKHLHVIPAVIVLFQDIEWSDPDWSEKQIQCASLIQSLKNSIQDRNTRLSLVLIQKSAPPPANEDYIASERASSLATACAISSKMLFILPHTDHLTGYTLRLESAFLEMAQAYYVAMSKQVRSHRDQLTASHTVLKIRHQFKLGFISEMRSDYSTALKHYSQAYSNLDEIRIVDTNCFEIKTVAGFLNYKICRLMFKLKVPRDSINHFLSHMDKYKSRVGFKELLFEHYAWISTQHSAFAELFCEAIKNDLPALQTQHPGIYFHKSAEYITKRKDAFIQSCSLSLTPTEPLSPTTLQNNQQPIIFSEFFGIRTVKTGEPYSDQQMISLIQDIERNFNHSTAIIYLLGQARTQFKTYKCLRFCKKLSILMAEEYFKCGDHSNALTLYSLMLSDYRLEKWNSIFSDVLVKTLQCAYLSASVVDFISCSIEALSMSIKYDQKDRIIVLENLWKVFQNVPPVSQSLIAPELRSHWEQSLSSYKSPIKIDLDRITEIIEGFVSFDKPEIKNDENVDIYFIMRICTDVPLKIRNFNAVITDGNESFKLKAIKYCIFNSLSELRPKELTDVTSSPINGYHNFDTQNDTKIEPDKYYKIIFTTDANQFFENSQLQITKIEIHMGTERNYAILLKNVTVPKINFKNYSRFKRLNDNIRLNSICYITPTFHLSIITDLNLPMLVNEYFKITYTINNYSNAFLQNVGISITIPQNLRNKVFLSTDITPSRQKLLPFIQIDIGDMTMQGNTKISFFVFSLIELPNIELLKKVWYSLETNRIKRKSIDISPTTDESPTIGINQIISNELIKKSSNIRIDYIDDKTCKKTSDDTIQIACVPDFKFVGRYYSLNRQPLIKIYRGENFLFRANIEVQSTCDLDILETCFICDPNLVQSTYSYKRKKFTKKYRQTDTLEDVIVLRTNSNFSNWLTDKDFEPNKTLGMLNRIKLANSLNTSTSSANSIGKALLKIPTNTTLIGNNNLLTTQNNSPMNTSITSDDGKLKPQNNNIPPPEDDLHKIIPRVVYHKAIESIQPAGHLKGIIKGVLLNETPSIYPIFGIYCIKWRRTGCKDENESKFLINGIDIDEPPLNLYCSIEEKMFVKIPMPLKIVFKNPSSKVIHLIATLNHNDNFMSSGHKHLNISVFAHSEKELVFNLYPLKVGWQTLPDLNLEYNTQADPSKDDSHKTVLFQLVQRSMPKKVFILPAPKQSFNKIKI